MESATPGGLKIFRTKIVEKFFFQKPLKMRFTVENADLRGYQNGLPEIFFMKKVSKMRFLIKPRGGKYYGTY